MKRKALINFFLAGSILLALPALQGQVISIEQNYAASSPAVVMVQTVFSATVYVNKVDVNQKRFMVLVDSVKRLDTTGTMFTAEEKLDIVVKALYNNPFRFFSATNEYFRQQHRILSSGTGFFVTGDGYIVTNSHIIDRDSAFIRQKFILSTYQEVTDANIRSLQSSWAMTLTDEQKNLLNEAYSFIYSQVTSMIIFDLKREIFVQYRLGQGVIQTGIARLPARLVRKGRPMPGKDVAILKVDSVKQMPTLSITPDSIPRIGEQVLVCGYPEPVTSNIFLAKETTLEPTLTTGVISAIKRSVGGWPVIQMDAVIAHGSSGSPVCDSKGNVIGLATFGTLEHNTGILASGYNFAIPASIISSYLDSAGVVAQNSEASLAWHEGLESYNKGYYRKALQQFKQVRDLNKNYALLGYYIDLAAKKIAAGEDRESFLQRSVFRIIAVLLIVSGIFLFFRWKQRRWTV